VGALVVITVVPLFVLLFEMLIMLRLLFGFMMVLNFFGFVDVFIKVVVIGLAMKVKFEV
jgi:hypothetical protein